MTNTVQDRLRDGVATDGAWREHTYDGLMIEAADLIDKLEKRCETLDKEKYRLLVACGTLAVAGSELSIRPKALRALKEEDDG